MSAKGTCQCVVAGTRLQLEQGMKCAASVQVSTMRIDNTRPTNNRCPRTTSLQIVPSDSMNTWNESRVFRAVTSSV